MVLKFRRCSKCGALYSFEPMSGLMEIIPRTRCAGCERHQRSPNWWDSFRTNVLDADEVASAFGLAIALPLVHRPRDVRITDITGA